MKRIYILAVLSLVWIFSGCDLLLGPITGISLIEQLKFGWHKEMLDHSIDVYDHNNVKLEFFRYKRNGEPSAGLVAAYVEGEDPGSFKIRLFLEEDGWEETPIAELGFEDFLYNNFFDISLSDNPRIICPTDGNSFRIYDVENRRFFNHTASGLNIRRIFIDNEGPFGIDMDDNRIKRINLTDGGWSWDENNTLHIGNNGGVIKIQGINPNQTLLGITNSVSEEEDFYLTIMDFKTKEYLVEGFPVFATIENKQEHVRYIALREFNNAYYFNIGGYILKAEKNYIEQDFNIDGWISKWEILGNEFLEMGADDHYITFRNRNLLMGWSSRERGEFYYAEGLNNNHVITMDMIVAKNPFPIIYVAILRSDGIVLLKKEI
jgi:hypothetical protein